MRRQLRHCPNKERGFISSPRAGSLAELEECCQGGEEERLTATAADRVRKSHGNPAMFSITKISEKNNSQQASLFFIQRFM